MHTYCTDTSDEEAYSPLPSPKHPTFFFCHCVVHVPLCCVSVRSAAPDFHKLNEDGELWLVNQGLKETIRCNCVLNTSVIFEHGTFAFSQERMCALHSHLFSLTLYQPFRVFPHISLSCNLVLKSKSNVD